MITPLSHPIQHRQPNLVPLAKRYLYTLISHFLVLVCTYLLTSRQPQRGTLPSLKPTTNLSPGRNFYHKDLTPHYVTWGGSPPSHLNLIIPFVLSFPATLIWAFTHQNRRSTPADAHSPAKSTTLFKSAVLGLLHDSALQTGGIAATNSDSNRRGVTAKDYNTSLMPEISLSHTIIIESTSMHLFPP